MKRSSSVSRRAPAPANGSHVDEVLAHARELDGAASRLVHAHCIWQELLSGQLAIVGSSYSATRWFLVLRRADGVALTGAARHLLEQVLVGGRQKCIAIDRGRSASSISTNVHRYMDALGGCFSPRRAPPLLSLLARAGAGAPVPALRVSTFVQAPAEYRVLSATRPELARRHELPGAEYDVLCAVVEGRSHAEIASQRGRSERTVANQISAGFRRLQVSSRAELIAKLLADAASEQRETTHLRAVYVRDRRSSAEALEDRERE